MAKFGAMPMPAKKGKKSEEESLSEGMDLFSDEEAVDELDGKLEDEAAPADASEDSGELAALSDDELLAECQKRGLKLGGAEE